MLRALFSPKVNLGISIVMFLAGVVLSAGNLLGMIGKNEPTLIYQMSAMALWVSGYGNILVSVVRQENNEDGDTPLSDD
jgi:hypothetical protein